MKYKVGDSVSLVKENKNWKGYGFDNSTVTKAWTTPEGVAKYSLKSSKGHTISIVPEARLKSK